jgi:hypothetical protein
LTAVYRTSPEVATLYQRCCRSVGDRAASILRRHVDPTTMHIADAIPADDIQMVVDIARYALKLSAMAQGQLILSKAELEEILRRA